MKKNKVFKRKTISIKIGEKSETFSRVDTLFAVSVNYFLTYLILRLFYAED